MPDYDVSFRVRPPHKLTEKAYGFWPAHGDGRDLVWVPKSQCRLERRNGVTTLFVADWLEAKNRLSKRIAS